MRINNVLACVTMTALLSTVTAFGADPRLLNLVMPDATSLAGANVTNAETTPFGQYVLAQLTSAADQQMQTFINATGFDPRHDVSEILAASAAGTVDTATGTAANTSGLILALGNFPVAQLTSTIATKSPELSVQTYGGATLITDSASKVSHSVAFLGTNIAIVGDTVSVKSAIDRSSDANSITPALAAQVQALSTTEDAWAVTNSSVASLIPGFSAATTGAGAKSALPIGELAGMFNGIQASSGGIKFGSTVQITGQAIASDAPTAKSLADVLQALISIASMAGGPMGGPAAGKNSEMASLAQLLQGLKVSADGAAINIALSVPETQIETLLNGLKKQAQPVMRPGVRPASVPAGAAPKPERAAM